jgi:hypothetical protein
LDVASQSLQAQAHATLDGAGWKAEVRSDLTVRQVAVERQRDHLSLSVGEIGEQTQHIAAGLSADLQRAGVGPAAIGKALTVLQGLFSCAVTWGHVQSNPVVGVRKPSAKRKRPVAPPSLALVERMRACSPIADSATQRCSPSSPTPACARRKPWRCRGTTFATARC